MSQTYTIEGIDECLKAFGKLDRDLRRNANGELRRASKRIAADVMARGKAAGSGAAPQASAVWAAARPKSDRVVVVAVPQTKVRLSGTRRMSAPATRGIGWAIETGSGYGPFRNPASGSLVARHIPGMLGPAKQVYQQNLARIMTAYGLL